MPVVTPKPTRRSNCTIVPPTRLGDDDTPPHNQLEVDVPPQHNLMVPTPVVASDTPSGNDPIVEEASLPVVADAEVHVNLESDSESSSSLSTDSDRNHPSKNYSRMELYNRLTRVKEAYMDIKAQLSRQDQELKAAHKEASVSERKLQRLDATESKLRKLCQDLHQTKVDKKVLCDRLKVACDATKVVESSKKDLKDSLEGKYKLEQQRTKLEHEVEVARLKHASTLARVTSDVLKENQEEKVKRLLEDIQTLKGKAKKYDDIAA